MLTQTHHISLRTGEQKITKCYTCNDFPCNRTEVSDIISKSMPLSINSEISEAVHKEWKKCEIKWKRKIQV